MRAASSFKIVSSDPTPFASRCNRVRSEGKFLVRGGEKFFIKGVTYGTFRPNGRYRDFPDPEVVDDDFRRMGTADINTVRLYTVPPRWLLDRAVHHGLSVVIGLPWNQHVAFLNDRATRRAIVRDIQDSVQVCAGHPAVLGYTVGNEIPTQIVRWHGAARVERFLAELCRVVKTVDPEALVTYANYPSTEYLELPFLDFRFYNVYLESHEAFDAYIARLQSHSSDKPLVLAEVGLDSKRHGQENQASALHNQISTAFARGCAGVCVFAWTDEWHRGGFDVEDWDFGLTTRKRHPKPALHSVSRAFETVPLAVQERFPRISVVVCTHNGADTIRDCLGGLAEVDYPNFEVIVVDDGSSDATSSIVSEYDVQLISTSNRGLSAARNVGMRAATGEIVAYLDDDARPDSHWLLYLARTFQSTSHAAVGGPNLSPSGDGFIAQAVDHAPGNPVHILIEDDIAEHVPGCNMAVRKACLEAIGGFDPQFCVAGDDVDMCWRLQQRGWTIGFSPAAVVWHHRRNSIRSFWRQQIGYGRAEALLERKWPDKYNGIGHPVWSGRVYGNGPVPRFRHRQRIYQGVWGSAAYQSVHETPPRLFESLLVLPEWYLMLGALSLLTAMTPLWTRMALFAPILMTATATTVFLHSRGMRGAQPLDASLPLAHRAGMRALSMFLHLLQPLARLWGRVSEGLTPWRHRNAWGYALPRPVTLCMKSDDWRSSSDRLHAVRAELRQAGYVVRCGAPYDRWDLEVAGGLLATTRIQVLVEEHGWGKQFIRFNYRPRYSRTALVTAGFLGSLSIIASWDRAWIAAVLLSFIALASVGQIVLQAASACGAARIAVQREFTRAERPVPAGVYVRPTSSPAVPDLTGPRDTTQPLTVPSRTLAKSNKQDAFMADIE